jgi:hypothetical protein
MRLLKNASFIVIFMITEYLLNNSTLIIGGVMMRIKERKLALMFAIMAILVSLTSSNIRIASSNNTDATLDLFTQQEPYSGIGHNVPSDAFGFDENVQIFALATYANAPVPNILVTFMITGWENSTLYRVASTGENGIATTSFRTPSSKNLSMTEWTVFGNARVSDSIVNDSVSFKVDWIVEIVSVSTISLDRTPQETFSRGSYLGVEIGLRSISMVPKTAYLTVTASSTLNNPVNSTKLNDFVVPPNETVVYAYLFLYIPKNANLGTATVYANAYASNSLPYCPEASAQFSIIGQMYFLRVTTEPVGITAIVGEGLYEENTNVSLTAPEYVSVLTAQYSFSYWDVDGTSQGSGNTTTVLMNTNHTATAHYIQIITYVLNITTTVGGVTNPLPGAYSYPAGSSVQVTANPNQNYVFDHWELNNVNVGSADSYTVLMDRNQTLKAVFSLATSGFFIPEWFFWPFLPLLILLILFLIILFLYYRRRGNRTEAAFYSGWTAWYYGYDLRNRRMKFRRTSR